MHKNRIVCKQKSPTSNVHNIFSPTDLSEKEINLYKRYILFIFEIMKDNWNIPFKNFNYIYSTICNQPENVTVHKVDVLRIVYILSFWT